MEGLHNGLLVKVNWVVDKTHNTIICNNNKEINKERMRFYDTVMRDFFDQVVPKEYTYLLLFIGYLDCFFIYLLNTYFAKYIQEHTNEKFDNYQHILADKYVSSILQEKSFNVYKNYSIKLFNSSFTTPYDNSILLTQNQIITNDRSFKLISINSHFMLNFTSSLNIFSRNSDTLLDNDIRITTRMLSSIIKNIENKCNMGRYVFNVSLGGRTIENIDSKGLITSFVMLMQSVKIDRLCDNLCKIQKFSILNIENNKFKYVDQDNVTLFNKQIIELIVNKKKYKKLTILLEALFKIIKKYNLMEITVQNGLLNIFINQITYKVLKRGTHKVLIDNCVNFCCGEELANIIKELKNHELHIVEPGIIRKITTIEQIKYKNNPKQNNINDKKSIKKEEVYSIKTKILQDLFNQLDFDNNYDKYQLLQEIYFLEFC